MTIDEAAKWARKQTSPWQQRDLRRGLRLKSSKLATWYCLRLVELGHAKRAGHCLYRSWNK